MKLPEKKLKKSIDRASDRMYIVIVNRASDTDTPHRISTENEREVSKVKDIYLMNKETGEIMPSKQVFKEFYKTHGIYDSVFDEWVETDLEVDDSDLELPDFAKVLAI